MMSRLLLPVLILLSSSIVFSQNLPKIENGVSQELAQWRASHYSDIRYILELRIEKKASTLKGTIVVRLNARETEGSTGAIAPIILDWRKITGHEKLSKVSNVFVNGKPAKRGKDSEWNLQALKGRERIMPTQTDTPSYYSVNEHLVFTDNVKAGENVVKLNFTSPILKSGSAITRYIDKEDGSEYIYSLFVPSDASTAFPVFDQPDLKARFHLTSFTPIDWEVITNSKNFKIMEMGPGNYTSHIGKVTIKIEVPKGQKRRIFPYTKPISTYLFAFAVGEFEEFSEYSKTEIKTRIDEKRKSNRDRVFTNYERSGSRVYVRKSQAKKFKPHAKEIFRLNRESIKFFEEYFDYKFPFPKYDLVLIPEFPFGGMEHAGATFLRESSMIFPTEPTANNYISRASLLFHENAHQWFGDTVTMKWFDDLWLKEGFATFMAYKAMEKVLPEYNAWKVFYERTKPRAYSTDVTKGTTPIYQKIPNLNSAKSAYGNIVYNKAPGFLKQAEFYLGETEFQSAVRAFLKDHEYKNAEWSDLVKAFEKSSKKNLNTWADVWVKKRSLPIIRLGKGNLHSYAKLGQPHDSAVIYSLEQEDALGGKNSWMMKTKVFLKHPNGTTEIRDVNLRKKTKRPTKFGFARYWTYLHRNPRFSEKLPVFIFPNYGDHAYGIFLLDSRSRKYVLANIQNEKDDFLRSMMWGALWDSVRFSELNPNEYVELAIKNIGAETDVTTISSVLGRVNTAFTYYLTDAQRKEIAPRLENLMLKRMKTKDRGRQITFYRAFLNTASTPKGRKTLKSYLKTFNKQTKQSAKATAESGTPALRLRTKDKFDIISRLIILNDKDAPKLLANLEKIETSDAAKRYAYAAKAGFATKANKAKYWNDFVNNREISESWIEAAARVWNSPGHSKLTLPYLEKALAELPNLKRNRKIFFVNGWLASFIGGQKSEIASKQVTRFLTKSPNLDIDLKRKILERLDGLERAVKIRKTYSK